MKWLCVLLGGALLLVGCSPDDASKAAICTKAVGVIVAAEASDDAQRRVSEAKHAASVLQSLSSQTSDQTLSAALRGAAATAGDGSTNLGPSRLKAWLTQEQVRFDTVRKACV
jgi:hypothetical protein